MANQKWTTVKNDPDATDLNKICRLCLGWPNKKNSELINIFNPTENCSLPLRIMTCFALEVRQNDGLPKGICPDCRYNLEKFYLFRNQSKHSDTKLRRYIRNLNAGKTTNLHENDDEFAEDNAESIQFLKHIDDEQAMNNAKEEQEKVQRFQDALREAIETEQQRTRDEEMLKFEEMKRSLFEQFKGNNIKPNVADNEPDDDINSNAETGEYLTNEIEFSDDNNRLTLAKQKFPNESEMRNDSIENYYMESIDGSICTETQDDIQSVEEKDDEYDAEFLENTADDIRQTEMNSPTSDKEEDNASGEDDVRYEICQEDGQSTQIIVRNHEGNIIFVELHEDENNRNNDQTHYENDIEMDQQDIEENNDELPTAHEVNEDGNIGPMEENQDNEQYDTDDVDENGELKIFSCDQCSQRFPRRIQLVRHSTFHLRKQGILCKYCEKWFPSKSSLERHIRIHTGEKPFQCQICDRAFIQKEILKRHMLIHTGERPFRCEICEKSFTQKDILRQHVNKFHLSEPIDADHKCPKCIKVFQHASGLSRHLLIHTGRTFDCENCGRKFTDKSALKRHVNTLHSGNNLKPKPMLEEQLDLPITRPIKPDPLLIPMERRNLPKK